MAALIKEGLDSGSHPKKHSNPHCQQKHKCKCKQAKKITQEEEEDLDNSNFLDSGSSDDNSSSSGSKSDGSNGMIPNDEVRVSLLLLVLYSPSFSMQIADMLPSKQHPVPNKSN